MAMNVGKISGAVCSRSVIKNISKNRTDVLICAGMGLDAGLLRWEQDSAIALTTNPVTVPVRDRGAYGVLLAANNLACGGAKPIAALLDVQLPEQAQEAELKALMRSADEACAGLGMQIIGGHTEVVRDIEEVHVTVTGIGRAEKKLDAANRIEPGMDIVLTKWIGLVGTSILVHRCRGRMERRLPIRLLDEAQGYDAMASVVKEAQVCHSLGVTAMHDVADGGVFGALWEFAENSKVGLEIDLRSIPIRQETVEVCECLGANPYLLYGGGALLIAAAQGHDIVSELHRHGIAAAVIGKAAEGNDRILLNEEEHRFLDPPRKEELWRVLDDTI